MTVREIETTLEDLQNRHENLDEATLLVLLKASGWEERAIIDAIAIYRGKYGAKSTSSQINTSDTKLLPSFQESPVFIGEVDVDHLLLDHYPNTENEAMLEVKKEGNVQKDENKEPESLIVENSPKEVVQPRVVESEPPHNLPVKPYEATSHVWSFARFKSIFFGDSPREEVEAEDESKEVKKVEPTQPSIPKTSEGKPKVSIVTTHESTHVIEMKATPLSRDEYRLVLLASTMLLAILLLLGYMYGRGRI
jgi:hypothetical protein